MDINGMQEFIVKTKQNKKKKKKDGDDKVQK